MAHKKANRPSHPTSIKPNARAACARADGSLLPDLAYTNQQAVPGPEGWVESPATVRSKQKSKEQFPHG